MYKTCGIGRENQMDKKMDNEWKLGYVEDNKDSGVGARSSRIGSLPECYKDYSDGTSSYSGFPTIVFWWCWRGL